MVSADEAAAAWHDAEVTEEVVILKAARAQEEGPQPGRPGRLRGGARTLLSSAAEDLRKLAPGSRQADELLDQAQSLEENAAAMSPERFDPQTNKLMRYQSRTTSQRRKR